MKTFTPLAALAALSLHFAPVAESQRPVPLLDSTVPIATLVMHDGRNAGPILHTDMSVFAAPPLPPGATLALPSVGCDGTILDNRMEDWDAWYTETDFFDPVVQTYTYLFNEAPSTRSFTLNASDASGIKRVEVRIMERDVRTYWGTMIVYDDGPTEFFNVSPSRAVSYLQPVWISSTVGPIFTHYEKRLELEPRQTRINTDVVLNFDMTAFGATARLRVIVEDNAGNISTSGVWLAPASICGQ